MSRILIIPDIHHQVDRVTKITKYESFDKCVCLGDWFDSYTDIFAEQAIECGEFLLQNIIPNKKFILLFGNHDVHYLGDNRELRCSGYSKSKHLAISSLFKNQEINRWKWYHIEDGVFFSHAGLNKIFLPSSVFENNKCNLTELDSYLTHQDELAFTSLKASCSKLHWYMGAGNSRGGYLKFGGLIWQDIGEFSHINGLSSVFGHSYCNPPRFIKTDVNNGEVYLNKKVRFGDGLSSLALDSHLNHYAILEDGYITVKEYKNL